ncbi:MULTISPECIES: (d)CMP kinase [unclassified Methylophaga]|jgi:cytidylate kinase|uniref:(d)CMP kinase n=2 Tax=Methylophaga TaxID=40222 RepID=UPI00259CFC32|nr:MULTISPECIES: (d)CMP kinase [unclassified Methylophaga]|tara:strand:+ start:2376 stop:3041 length:666 start_codon:yes stop_codon:yes gene_type:complete
MTDMPILTIDGPSGSGKGTIAQMMARELGWHYLDSGAIYRVLAFASLKHQIPASHEGALMKLAQHLDLQFELDENGLKVLLEGQEVSQQIRTEKAGNAASKVAVIPSVRAALLQRQRDFAQAPGLVTDGRDMGTVVFPDAQFKVFLTASAEERALRRHKQLKEKGIESNLSDLIAEISERDKRDSERKVAPLLPAKDALILDSTELGITAVYEKVRSYCAI